MKTFSQAFLIIVGRFAVPAGLLILANLDSVPPAYGMSLAQSHGLMGGMAIWFMLCGVASWGWMRPKH